MTFETCPWVTEHQLDQLAMQTLRERPTVVRQVRTDAVSRDENAEDDTENIVIPEKSVFVSMEQGHRSLLRVTDFTFASE